MHQSGIHTPAGSAQTLRAHSPLLAPQGLRQSHQQIRAARASGGRIPVRASRHPQQRIRSLDHEVMRRGHRALPPRWPAHRCATRRHARFFQSTQDRSGGQCRSPWLTRENGFQGGESPESDCHQECAPGHFPEMLPEGFREYRSRRHLRPPHCPPDRKNAQNRRPGQDPVRPHGPRAFRD